MSCSAPSCRNGNLQWKNSNTFSLINYCATFHWHRTSARHFSVCLSAGPWWWEPHWGVSCTAGWPRDTARTLPARGWTQARGPSPPPGRSGETDRRWAERREWWPASCPLRELVRCGLWTFSVSYYLSDSVSLSLNILTIQYNWEYICYCFTLIYHGK